MGLYVLSLSILWCGLMKGLVQLGSGDIQNHFGGGNLTNL